ncbi:MAG: hypothetical protein IT165_16890 [Bryobacterales bacterium]|nr:hypothetical protein [Bryobacterales bacterium]
MPTSQATCWTTKAACTDAEQEKNNKDFEWACKLVEDFKKQPAGSVWPNLNRDKVAGGLCERVIDSTRINQSQTWLCGATSAVRAWADDFPVDYAWLGIQLFNTGRGRLGRGKMLGEIIESSLDLRRSSVPAGMPHPDWLISVIGDYLSAFDLFSWGKRWRVPQDKTKRNLLVKDMLVSYHGFVAARGY